jgi:hypothetical protein
MVIAHDQTLIVAPIRGVSEVGYTKKGDKELTLILDETQADWDSKLRLQPTVLQQSSRPLMVFLPFEVLS